MKLAGGQDEVEDVAILGEGACAAAGLDDDGRIGFDRRAHDGLDLFHIVDVECADAVTALGGLVEELPHGYEGHGKFSFELAPMPAALKNLRRYATRAAWLRRQ